MNDLDSLKVYLTAEISRLLSFHFDLVINDWISKVDFRYEAYHVT